MNTAIDVLRELVRLKDIHDALESPAPDDGTPEGYRRRLSMKEDYTTNKPKAWEAARRLTECHPKLHSQFPQPKGAK